MHRILYNNIEDFIRSLIVNLNIKQIQYIKEKTYLLDLFQVNIARLPDGILMIWIKVLCLLKRQLGVADFSSEEMASSIFL